MFPVAGGHKGQFSLLSRWCRPFEPGEYVFTDEVPVVLEQLLGRSPVASCPSMADNVTLVPQMHGSLCIRPGSTVMRRSASTGSRQRGGGLGARTGPAPSPRRTCPLSPSPPVSLVSRRGSRAHIRLWRNPAVVTDPSPPPEASQSLSGATTTGPAPGGGYGPVELSGVARRAHYSNTVLSEIAGGRKLPTLAVTLAYVDACGDDQGEWEAGWCALAAELANVLELRQPR